MLVIGRTGFAFALASFPLRLFDPSDTVMGIPVPLLCDGMLLGGSALASLACLPILWELYKSERRGRALWSGELGPLCPHCEYDTGDYSITRCPECGEAIERTLPGRRPTQLPAKGSENTP
ncbi:MAG: hypothetical protein SFY95_12360 [Planctomycetota bacterium]|nr:hypothetical protein [Planctomycetota bacterium]